MKKIIINKSLITCNLSLLTNLKSGQVMLIGIIFMAVILILSASLFDRVARFLNFSSRSILNEQASHLAEAGVDFALWQLNKNAGVCPAEFCDPEQTVGTTGSFIVTVQDKTLFLKTITATGYIPNSTNPRAKRTIKTDTLVSGQSIAFRYAVQIGKDGVKMANSSEITGTAYSNGNITGTGPSIIDGDAYAVGTITSPPLVTGSLNPGAKEETMPQVDYDYWKNTASAGGTIDCNATPSECNISAVTKDIGPKKYQGNVEITGSAQVTMNGPVYITGNFSIKNLAQLKLSDSFGSVGTVLIVDGTITVSQNGYFKPTDTTPKGYILAVTTSTANPSGCTNPAVSIQNMGAAAIFYALEGKACLQNQTQVSAIVAKSLEMLNSARLRYDWGLASAQFSGKPGGSWQIKKGTYRFTSSP